MKGEGEAERLYLELVILLIEREIIKFRRGEKSAFASFTSIARLAENATKATCGLRPRRRGSLGARRAKFQGHSLCG
jgi:hypothetical protein